MSTAAELRGSPVRLVLGIGLLAGTVLQIVAMVNGVHASWPGLAGLPGAIVGYVVEWLAAVVLATLAAELLRRYHRIAARGAWRATRAGGGSLGGRLTGWAGRRWEARQGRPAAGTTAPAAAHPPAVQAPAPAAIPVAAPAAAVA